MVVTVLFAEQTVLPDGESVVGGEDDERIFRQTRSFQGVQHLADLRVEVRDGSIVFAYVPANFAGVARRRHELFVAHTVIAVVEGVFT